MCRKTGEWKPVKGKTYPASKAKLAGDAFLQEAVSNLLGSGRMTTDFVQTFGTDHVIATGIQGNDSTITFEVEGKGADQWVSFYHQSTSPLPFLQLPLTPSLRHRRHGFRRPTNGSTRPHQRHMGRPPHQQRSCEQRD